MTDAAAPFAPAAEASRAPAWLACAALAGGVGALALKLSPTPAPALALAALAGLAAAVLTALSEAKAAAGWARALAGVAAAAFAARFIGDPQKLEWGLGFGALGLTGYAVREALQGGRRLRLTAGAALTGAGLIAALAAFNVWYVTASRDLMIADFMFYRVLSIAVGTLAREGNVAGLLLNLVGSMPKDYSWAPALLPGFALAAFGLLSRAVYQGAILVFYAAPALLALAWGAREIAGLRGARAFAFALAGVAAAYPFGLTIAARGMPDIGGIALVMLALRLADRLAGVLALRPGRDLGGIVRKLSLALAACLFCMFLFRRWYAFAAVAILLALAAEVLAVAVRRGARFRWREAALAAATGVLTLLALLAPVLADWLPNPGAHDYAAMYAAYRKTPAVLAEVVGAWAGYAPLGAALLGGAYVLARHGTRFARLAFAVGPLSALLFLRVQSPYPHHLYLLAPLLTLFVAAPLLLLFARSRPAGLAALATLALLTLTPAGALAPKGLFPSAARPPAPRADLAELARMKDWVDARATPSHKVCGLGSSYTFSGQLIGELWQLRAVRSPLTRDKAQATSVGMTDVDTVDGPPNPEMKNCAVMLVGDPVQTHVIPSFQLTVTLPSREMLEGIGIGAHYRRTGEVFALEHGVRAVAFERTTALTDADMAALADRWRAARAEVEGR